MPTYDDRINGTVRWAVKDYSSATVTLYQEDYEHIAEHHPVMKNHEEDIKDAVQMPDSVYRDKEYDNRRVYFRSASATTYPQKAMVTTVVVEGADWTWTDARVVTAYPGKKEGGAENDLVYKRN